MTDAASFPLVPDKTSLDREYKHSRPLTACSWDPQSRFIFFGAEDNFVHRFDLASESVASLAAHDSWVRAMGVSPDGEMLYSGGYDGRLVVWPAAAENPEPLRVVDAHQGWIRSLAVSPDGGQLATCGNDHLVKTWDTRTGELERELAGHQCHVYNVTYLPDGSALISCDLKGVVIAWDLESGSQRELLTVEALHKYDQGFKADIGGARCIAVRSDGAEVALGGITNVTNAFAGVGEVVVALVDPVEGKLVRLLQSKEKTQGTVWGVAHHPAGFWLGASAGGGGGWLWFWPEGATEESFKLKLKSDARGMMISPDRTRLAVAHSDAHLRMYTLNSG